MVMSLTTTLNLCSDNIYLKQLFSRVIPFAHAYV